MYGGVALSLDQTQASQRLSHRYHFVYWDHAGVATLITVMAVMNGFRTELLTRILGINGHLLVEPFDAPLVDYESIAKGISSIAGIKYAIPLVEGQVLASHSGVSTGAIVRGIRGFDLGRITLVAKNIRDGNIAGFEASEGVIIGTRMAQNLKLQLGDMLTMVFPSSNLVQSQSTLLKVYPVSAIFEVGMSQYDASVIYMPILEAQQSFKVERQAQMIEVFVDNPDAVNSLSKSIEAVVPLRIRLTDWRQRNQTFCRSSGSTECDAHNPDTDCGRCRSQHHIWSHHAG